MQGLVFDIQRFSIHDGHGIRTLVFLKGCPLRCLWCCNPESQSSQVQTMRLSSQCIHCQACTESAEECPAGALVQSGKYMTVQAVMDEVAKDEVFYSPAEGGVTLSGGEVLTQAPFAAALLKACKESGYHTAVETSGFGPPAALDSVAEYTDLFLFDLKVMDEEKSRRYTGVSSRGILENLRRLVKSGHMVIPRIPLVPGYTMDEANIRAIGQFIQEHDLPEVHLLPFHQLGSSKYESLKMEYHLESLRPPTKNQVKSIQDTLERLGLTVIVGGR